MISLGAGAKNGASSFIDGGSGGGGGVKGRRTLLAL